METRDTLSFPGVLICSQKHQSEDMPFDFSGLFNPVEKLLMWSSHVNMEFRQLTGMDEAQQPTNTDSSSLSDANRTTDENGTQEICTTPLVNATCMVTT